MRHYRNAERTGAARCLAIVSRGSFWGRYLGRDHGRRGRMRLADWQINEVNIVVKCPNRFLIPKIDF